MASLRLLGVAIVACALRTIAEFIGDEATMKAADALSRMVFYYSKSRSEAVPMEERFEEIESISY